MARVQIDFPEPSLTQQQFKKDCDLNEILKRFKNVTGRDYLKCVNSALGGSYGDFSQVGDYRTALHAVRSAEAKFMALPSKIRSRFDNDPGKFLDFVENPNNLKEMVELGLVDSKRLQEPVEAISADTTPPVKG